MLPSLMAHPCTFLREKLGAIVSDISTSSISHSTENEIADALERKESAKDEVEEKYADTSCPSKPWRLKRRISA
jgi:hypothetical protein